MKRNPAPDPADSTAALAAQERIDVSLIPEQQAALAAQANPPEEYGATEGGPAGGAKRRLSRHPEAVRSRRRRRGTKAAPAATEATAGELPQGRTETSGPAAAQPVTDRAEASDQPAAGQSATDAGPGAGPVETVDQPATDHRPALPVTQVDRPTATPLTLIKSLRGVAEHAATLGFGGWLGWSNAAMLSGTCESLFPEHGMLAAAGLVGAEAAAGYLLESGSRSPAMRALFIALVWAVFPACEVMLSDIRETADHKHAVAASSGDIKPQTQCVDKDPPKEYGETRLPIWQAGEKDRMEKCRGQQGKEVEEIKKQRGKLVEAADTHSFWEKPFRALLAVAMSLVIAGCATRFPRLLDALESIPSALVADAAWLISLFRRPAAAQAAAAAPAPPSGEGGSLVPAFDAAPASREPIWSRVTRWPLVARLLGRQRRASAVS